jgi:hypothetical protein
VSVAVAVVALFAGAATRWSPRKSARKPRRRARATDAASAAKTGEAIFRREGEYWTISYEAGAFRLADAKGLRYIHRLLQTPEVEVHARELAAIDRPPSTPPPTVAPDDGLAAGSTRDFVLDSRAREELRLRVEDLREEIDEAQANADEERASQARIELDFILGELRKQIRPGGAARPLGDQTERARVNVTRAIQASIRKIRGYDPSLAHHLDREIRTGTFCRYSPGPGEAPAWRL